MATTSFISTLIAYATPNTNTNTEMMPASASPRISEEKVIKELDKNQIQQELKRLEDENIILNIELETLKDETESDKALLDKLKEELNTKEAQIQELSRIVTYDPSNLGSISNATYSHMRRALKGTTMEDLAEAFVDAEKAYSVNAFFLAGLVANESSWATSPRAVNQNNLTGHAVYTDSSDGTYFSSKAESILKTAEDIRRDYLDPNGVYNNGVSLSGVNTKYSQLGEGIPNPAWYEVINDIASGLRNSANDF